MPNQWTQSQRLQCQGGKNYPLTVIKAENIPTVFTIYVLVKLIYIFTGFTQIYVIVFKLITTNETSEMIVQIVTVCFLLLTIIPGTVNL